MRFDNIVCFLISLSLFHLWGVAKFSILPFFDTSSHVKNDVSGKNCQTVECVRKPVFCQKSMCLKADVKFAECTV